MELLALDAVVDDLMPIHDLDRIGPRHPLGDQQAAEQAHPLRKIFDHANDAILLIDVGLTPETFAQLLAELEIDQPRLIESRHRRRDGSVFPSEVSLCAHGEAQAPSYIALLRDISQRKTAEAAIARVAPVDSGFWWLLTLQAYVHVTGVHFNGRELSAELAERVPGLEIVLMSGAHDLQPDPGLAPHVRTFLRKSVSLHWLHQLFGATGESASRRVSKGSAAP